jgi:hypothetical protein
MKGFQNRHYEVITAATDDYDMFDGESFDANDYVDFIVFAKIRSLLSKASIAI